MCNIFHFDPDVGDGGTLQYFFATTNPSENGGPANYLRDILEVTTVSTSGNKLCSGTITDPCAALGTSQGKKKIEKRKKK